MVVSTWGAVPLNGRPANSPGDTLRILGVILASGLALWFLFRDGLLQLYPGSGAFGYGQGLIIPLVAVYLLWLRGRELTATRLAGSGFGVLLVLLSLALLVLGERSAVYTLMQFGFFLSLSALVVAGGGLRALQLAGVPLLCLLLMIPLPQFIHQNLMAGLELVSAGLGVAMLRAAGLSVLLEGNVIDFANYQVEASGIGSATQSAHLLLGLGVLLALLFRGAWWQRLILLVAPVPVAILLDSVRIATVGLVANTAGRRSADAFLETVDDGVMLLAAVGVLLTTVWVFARLERRRVTEVLGLYWPPVSDLTGLVVGLRPNRPLYGAVAVLVLAALASLVIPRPPSLIPERSPFASFPVRVGEWVGREAYVDPSSVASLRVSDFLMRNFWRRGDALPVEVWIAYYDSQAKGASVHSPRACLTGGGWRIETVEQQHVPEVLAGGGALKVNRARMAMGEQRRLVYYWFAQRGRQVTNEYLVKWYIFWDGLRLQRTDGALVRLSTAIDDRSGEPAADARLAAFIRAADPALGLFLPGRNAPLRAGAAAVHEPGGLRQALN